MKAIFLAVVLHTAFALGAPVNAQEIPYQSQEFRSGDSRIPVVFACMFAGHQSGLGVRATETAMDFMMAMDVTPQQVDTWGHDATIYISQELAQTDWAKYWRSNCEQQFKKMREAFSE